jgi:hypothetical protein
MKFPVNSVLAENLRLSELAQSRANTQESLNFGSLP